MSFMERSKELINRGLESKPTPPRPTGMPPRPTGAMPPRPKAPSGKIPVPGATSPKPPMPKPQEEVKEEVKVETAKPKATDGLLKDNPFAKMREERKEAAPTEAEVIADAKIEQVVEPVQEAKAEETNSIDAIAAIADEVVDEIVSETKEEVKEEVKEETKEEVVKEEVKPKKKTRSVRKSKKKEETPSSDNVQAEISQAPIAPSETVTTTIVQAEMPNVVTSISFDEAMSSIKSNFVDEDWEAKREEVTEKLKDIVISNDMNSSSLKSVLSELSELKTEIWDAFSDTKTRYESLVSKEPAGLIERVRVVNSTGTNAEQRKANGIIAVMNYKDQNGNTINLFELLDEVRDRYNFLKGLMEIIEYKSKLLVTMLGGLKLEK